MCLANFLFLLAYASPVGLVMGTWWNDKLCLSGSPCLYDVDVLVVFSSGSFFVCCLLILGLSKDIQYHV